MEKSKIQEVSERLAAAIVAAKSRGYAVEPGSWGVHVENTLDRAQKLWAVDDPVEDGGKGCLCPMACVILDQPADSYFMDYEDAAARALDIDERQVSNFIIGFDRAETDVSDFQADEFYELGVRLRSQLGAVLG